MATDFPFAYRLPTDVGALIPTAGPDRHTRVPREHPARRRVSLFRRGR
jgi:hypothetical protein